MGRRTGSRNLGYFYRTGRGWFATIDGKMTPLLDEEGVHLRLKATPAATLKAAHRRIIAAPAEIVNGETDGITVEDVCNAYLAKVKSDKAMKTFKDRGDTLFDFCTGLPPRFRDSKEVATPTDRIHKGYGTLTVAQLIPHHIEKWLQAHSGWQGGKRTRIQAVKRALNYGVEVGLIPNPPGSPLKGYKVPPAIARVTYLTSEQEAAICKVVNPQFAIAVKVCIRTGARPGKEFAYVEARHVHDQQERMEWVFQPKDSKTGKQTKRKRIVRITDPEIIKIVREQVKAHPKGPIFRNTKSGAWTRKNLELSFRKAKDRLRKQGIELDEDACMYACRHTYAKRVLQGYWTGRQTNIETLARLMGNSPEVCREHYLQWTESYEEPLWESA